MNCGLDGRLRYSSFGFVRYRSCGVDDVCVYIERAEHHEDDDNVTGFGFSFGFGFSVCETGEGEAWVTGKAW